MSMEQIDDVYLLAAAMHGFTNHKSDDNERIAFGSTVLNRLDSGRPEFGIDGVAPSSIAEVLYSNKSPYYEVKGKNERTNLAMRRQIPSYNEEQFKKDLSIAKGLIEGNIKRMDGEFLYKKSEVGKLKETKKHDFSLTPKMSDVGEYGMFGYEKKKKSEKKDTTQKVNLDVPTYRDVSFDEAFSDARKGGYKEFKWNGKRYNTNTK